MRLCVFHCAVGIFYAIAQSTATTSEYILSYVQLTGKVASLHDNELQT